MADSGFVDGHGLGADRPTDSGAGEQPMKAVEAPIRQR
jgi:hypothetical protein